MGFGLIAFGFIFLVNPNYNIIDILPDFIGLLLIYRGLTRVSRLNDDVRSGRKNALILAGIDAVKLLCIGLLSQNDPTTYLLFSLLFGVVECIVFTLFIRELFTGLDHLGTRHSCLAILETKKTKRGKIKERSTGVRRAILVFYFIRTAFSIIPELSELQLFGQAQSYIFSKVNYSSFKGAYYFFSTVIVLAVGIPITVKAVRFFLDISRDREFIGRLSELEKSFLKINDNYFLSVRMKNLLCVFAAAMFFTMIPTSDGLVNSPLLVPAILLAVVSVMLKKREAVFDTVLSALLVVLSVVGITLRSDFYASYEIKNTLKSADALKKFTLISVIDAAQYVLFAVIVVSVGTFLVNRVYIHRRSFEGTDVIDDDLMSVVRLDQKKCMRHKKRQNVFVIVYSLIGALLPIGAYFSEKYIRSIGSSAASSLDIPSRIFIGASLIHFALGALLFIFSVLFAAFAIRTVYRPSYEWGPDEVKNKYNISEEIMDWQLGTIETKFADIIWDREPISSPELVKVCAEELGWKKSTTYTVLRRLCEKGLFVNEKTVVRAIVSKEEFHSSESKTFVENSFKGSLPAFLAAFLNGKKISDKEADEIRKMIDSCCQDK